VITLSSAATTKIREVIGQQTEPVFGLRVSVYKGGCSGYQYGMSLAPQQESGDWVGDFDGVKVLVDPDSAPFLSGVNIDYVETLQQSGFTIQNPNAARGCGCGNSFETESAEGGEKEASGGGCGSGCGCGGH
jgi:iron-sulfur cluster assembly protein